MMGGVAGAQSVAARPGGRLAAKHRRDLSGRLRRGTCRCGRRGRQGSGGRYRSGSGSGFGGTADDVPVRGLTGRAGSERWYTFDVPAGSNLLVAQIGEGSGDVDLYTRHALRPTDTEYNCRPQGTGNSKTCVRVWPGSGTWHIRIKAITDYSGPMVKAKAE